MNVFWNVVERLILPVEKAVLKRPIRATLRCEVILDNLLMRHSNVRIIAGGMSNLRRHTVSQQVLLQSRVIRLFAVEGVEVVGASLPG